MLIKSHREAERGVALVLALLILLILTILGAASMSNIALQERMSGNANLQALAFKAASSGVPGSIGFAMNPNHWGGNQTCLDDEEWSAPAGAWTEVVQASGVVAQFKRQVRCRRDQELFESGVSGVRSQLYVLTEGRVVRPGTDRALSTRQIEVLIERRGGVTESAIRIEGTASLTAATPNSANFKIDAGTGGVAMSAATIENRDAIRDSVNRNRVNQYQPNPPGIVQSDYHGPWDTPQDLAALMNELKRSLMACGPGGDGFIDGANCHIPNGSGAPCEPGNLAGCLSPVPFDRDRCFYYGSNQTRSGTGSGLGAGPPTVFGLHFVDGAVDLGGQSSNHGLIISTGQFSMSGNANLTGKALALGGTFRLYGGGNEATSGGIFLANLDLNTNPTPAYGPANLDLSGGGNHQISFQCETSNQALALLSVCGVRTPPPPAACTAEGPGGGTRDVIASWRENFGWREAL